MRLLPLIPSIGRKALPFLLAALLAFLITVLHYQLIRPAAWNLPTDYSGDAFETLARIKAAAEGDTLPLAPQRINRLGAPFGAYWNAYPTPDRFIMLLLGALSKVMGLFAAANLGLILAQVTAVLSCYWVLRYLRCRWEWALVGALLFAFTYNSFHRGLAHYSFVFTWTIPLGLLSASLIASSKRLRWGSKECWICLFTALAFGAHNPYYHFFWLLLVAWALLLQLLGDRNWKNLSIGLGAIALSFAAFLILNIENWIFISEPDGLPLLVRSYSGTERYALKPVEMFIPPIVHRWDLFAFFGHRYFRWSEWRGEFFLPYLGLSGVTALVWLTIVMVRDITAKRPIPAQAMTVVWLLAFCSIGGIANLLAFFFEFQLFRATNRIAVFISCILLCFLMLRCSRLSLRLPRWVSISAASLLCLVGILDQVPRGESAGEKDLSARRVAADREFAKKMETELLPGSLIFQLPVVGFPEVPPPFELADYEHFRPYLHTNTLRFSYGAAKFRSRSQWQNELAQQPAEVLVKELEKLGFAGLYLNRRGFKDRGQLLLSQLNVLGYKRRINSQLGNQILVILNPASDIRLPMAHSFTYGKGWHPVLIEKTRWAYTDAAFTFHNPYATPREIKVNLGLVGATPGNITLEQNEASILVVPFNITPLEFKDFKITLAPGVNRFRLCSDNEAIRRDNGRYQLRKVGITKAEVEY